MDFVLRFFLERPFVPGKASQHRGALIFSSEHVHFCACNSILTHHSLLLFKSDFTFCPGFEPDAKIRRVTQIFRIPCISSLLESKSPAFLLLDLGEIPLHELLLCQNELVG